jgi:hypothetical protein
VTELSGYAFSPLREGEIALHRGSGNGLAREVVGRFDQAEAGRKLVTS